MLTSVSRIRARVRQLRLLGPLSVARVLLYRLALKSGYYERRLKIGQPIPGSFFTANEPFDAVSDVSIGPDDRLVIDYFSYRPVDLTLPIRWHDNPIDERSAEAWADSHWSRIPDFNPQLGDIKLVWEASRFDWLPKLAWNAREHPSSAIESTDRLLNSWTQANPVNSGINWKCGQEASLRVMNVLLAARIFGAPWHTPTPALIQFCREHLERIAATTSYARGQDNNHGTSEAAALLCVGLWLQHRADTDSLRTRAGQWHIKGERLLKDRLCKLVLADGSFSQQSLTYHRLMLDTLAFANVCLLALDAPPLERDSRKALARATLWLHAAVDDTSGDGPNLGANDGAYFANIAALPYRDFRPTLARCLPLFCEHQHASSRDDAMLDVFGVSTVSLPLQPAATNHWFEQGGYARLNLPDVAGHVFFRYPKYRFRPYDADAHQLDLWLCGNNITCDSGSYSYNREPQTINDALTGTAGHSTVSFDERDQMPRVSRFLRDYWLRPDAMHFDARSNYLSSRYTDTYGATHERQVSIQATILICVDVLSGTFQSAALSWHLPDWPWSLAGNTLQVESPQRVRFTLEAEAPMTLKLVDAQQSRHYLALQSSKVLVAEVQQPTTISTRINWS